MITMEEKINVCIQAIAATDENSWLKAAEMARNILAESGADSTASDHYAHTVKRIHYEIETAFARIGLPSSLMGYEYLVEAITKVVLDKKAINCIVKGLYVDIAKEFNTTGSRVERAIRHAIETAYYRGNVDEIDKCLGYYSNEDGKCTNGEFIANFARYIRYKI